MSTPRRLTVADLRMESVARLAAGAALFVVAASFIYSFAQIKWVSDQLGVEQAWLSYLFPLIIDAPALVASALTVALHDRPIRVRQYAWTVLVVFTSASWVCNAVHALTHSSIGLLSGPAGTALVVLISGLPPVGVVLGMHLWAFALRHSPAADQRAPEREHERAQPARKSRAIPAPEPAPSAPARAAERPAPVAAAPSTPEPVKVAQNGAQRATPDIDETARQVWAEMRAETTPGQSVDAAEMRRRLVEQHGDKVPHVSTVRRWRARFEAEADVEQAEPVGETRESVAV